MAEFETGVGRVGAAERGGQERERRGGFGASHEHARAAGAKGGTTVKERYGSEFYRRVGRMGGQATRRKLGREHFAAIGRVGGSRPKTRAE